MKTICCCATFCHMQCFTFVWCVRIKSSDSGLFSFSFIGRKRYPVRQHSRGTLIHPFYVPYVCMYSTHIILTIVQYSTEYITVVRTLLHYVQRTVEPSFLAEKQKASHKQQATSNKQQATHRSQHQRNNKRNESQSIVMYCSVSNHTSLEQIHHDLLMHYYALKNESSPFSLK